MVRNSAAVLAGLVFGIVTVMVTEGFGHRIFPPPAGLDLKDPGVLVHIIDRIPVGAKLAVLAAWGLGIFLGSAVALYVSRARAWTGWTVTLVMAAFSVYTLFVIPHPAWMIAGAAAVTLAGSLGAQKIAGTLEL